MRSVTCARLRKFHSSAICQFKKFLVSVSEGKNQMPKTKVKRIAVTQIKSSIGRLKKHKSCLLGLGLRKIGHTVVVEDTPSVRGMVKAVDYMIRVEEL